MFRSTAQRPARMRQPCCTAGKQHCCTESGTLSRSRNLTVTSGSLGLLRVSAGLAWPVSTKCMLRGAGRQKLTRKIVMQLSTGQKMSSSLSTLLMPSRYSSSPVLSLPSILLKSEGQRVSHCCNYKSIKQASHNYPEKPLSQSLCALIGAHLRANCCVMVHSTYFFYFFFFFLLDYLVAVTIFWYIQDFGRHYTYSTCHSMSNIRVGNDQRYNNRMTSYLGLWQAVCNWMAQLDELVWQFTHRASRLRGVITPRP